MPYVLVIALCMCVPLQYFIMLYSTEYPASFQQPSSTDPYEYHDH